MITSGLMSSKTDEWATPQDLFDSLNDVYDFTLDPCATPENAKCDKFYTREDDGLMQEWTGRVFMNPPYGREIGKWIAKASHSAKTSAELVVCLLPARTDTRSFHEYIYEKAKIIFLKGRVRFVGNGKLDNAPFPNMIVIFSSLGEE